MGCVYLLSFPNQKYYIGLTKQPLKNRFSAECRSVQLVGRAIRKYGRENIKVNAVFQSNDLNVLCCIERFLIGEFQTHGSNGYNLTDGGEGPTNRIVSDETKKKLSESGMGHPVSFETRLKLSNIHTGRKLSNDHKKKIGKAGTGRKHNNETKKKISDAHKKIKHKKHSDATKRKMSVSQSIRRSKEGIISD